MQDFKASSLPDTAHTVRHTEFLGFGNNSNNKRGVHSLDFTDSSNLGQLELEERKWDKQEDKASNVSSKITHKPFCPFFFQTLGVFKKMLQTSTYVCVSSKSHCDLHADIRSQSTRGGVKGGWTQWSLFTLELGLFKAAITIKRQARYSPLVHWERSISH